MSSSMIWIGMDVHKDTVMVAVYAEESRVSRPRDDFSRPHAPQLPSHVGSLRARAEPLEHDRHGL